MKILAKFPDEIKAPLMKLNSSLNGRVSVHLHKSHSPLSLWPCHAIAPSHQSICLTASVFQSIEEFLCNVEAAAEECGIMLKKGDKKKEK